MAGSSEQARYEVRTPMWLWMTNGVITAACVLVTAAWLVFGWQAHGGVIFVLSALVGTTVAFWLSMGAYRVGGGRNLIRFYPDRVEVPSPTTRQPLVFPRDGIVIDVSDVVMRYSLGLAAVAGNVRRGKIIALRHGPLTRKLSTLTLAADADEPALVADFQLFAAGQPAIGRAGHSAPKPRTSYDERLDRELAQLD